MNFVYPTFFRYLGLGQKSFLFQVTLKKIITLGCSPRTTVDYIDNVAQNVPGENIASDSPQLV